MTLDDLSLNLAHHKALLKTLKRQEADPMVKIVIESGPAYPPGEYSVRRTAERTETNHLGEQKTYIILVI